MTYEMVETFLSLVETESITKTSQALNVSQSTVSNRLTSLEEELNAILFKRGRGKKGTRLTENGKSFISIAQSWMDLFRRTSHWKTVASQDSVIIGSLETIHTCLLTPFYENISNNTENNHITLRIRTRVASSLYEMLKYHEIDIGLTAHEIFYTTLDIKPLFSEDYFVILSNDALGSSVGLVDLSKLPIKSEIFHPWDQYFISWHEDQIGLINNTKISVDLLPLAINFMKQNSTWMVAPSSAAKVIAAETNKSLCKIKDPPPCRTCYLIKNKTPIYDKIQSINYIEKQLLQYVRTLDDVNHIA